MHFSTAFEWFDWISTIHLTEMELGLDRVKQVAAKLDLLTPACPVIVVGGTNGKGSTVAGLESIYGRAGYQVGAFTSPMVFKHNEQVRINGEQVSDEAFCAAFQKIEDARANISLTPFEFHTLAALLIFKLYSLDVLILEIGLGGRLDAVNIIDANVSVITSISLDHVEWLGDTREKIAYEKAGIFRPGCPAVCGDLDPPQNLLEIAKKLGTPLYTQGRSYFYGEAEDHWSFEYNGIQYFNLPYNMLATQNMATVLMVVTILQAILPVTSAAIHQGLANTKLFGRIQVMPGQVTEIYDVSHNAASVLLLKQQLLKMNIKGKSHAVFSMLTDKDIVTSLKTMRDLIDTWYIAPLSAKRAAPMTQLLDAFAQAQITEPQRFATIQAAYDAAKQQAKAGDRIIVFGSFHTVSDVWLHRQ